MNEIERAWNEEVREKKRAASGVHGKKGKRGYVGTMRTPVDLMTDPKERRAYEGTSPVRSSIVDPKNTLVPYEEFKQMSRQAKILLLYKLRSSYSTKAIADAWGVSDKTLYYYYRAYGIKRETPPPGTASGDESKERPSSGSDNEILPKVADTSGSSKPEPRKESFSRNECCFMLIGNYEAQSLGKKLNGLAFMLDDKLKYQVEIHVKELME